MDPEYRRAGLDPDVDEAIAELATYLQMNRQDLVRRTV